MSVAARLEPYPSYWEYPVYNGAHSWIDPQGRVYYVPYAGHTEAALALCLEFHIECSTCDPCMPLERAGWMHIAGGFLHFPVLGVRFTQAQHDAIFDMSCNPLISLWHRDNLKVSLETHFKDD